ncbi:MAG: hypothetical protein DCF25_18675 [Leptolyngbya foveolarum]|uniref:Uncharacterized protein n=1 Tax=Leptolyngbya foveolarum TaxID=47253 RepID=A0A2W4TW17_9CYAN|nr:MAG: hypothetical protein DCF25_18675 [Leptolyngbya foveolarum]
MVQTTAYKFDFAACVFLDLSNHILTQQNNRYAFYASSSIDCCFLAKNASWYDAVGNSWLGGDTFTTGESADAAPDADSV